MARLPDADQGELPLPRLDSGGAYCTGPGAFPGSRAADAGSKVDRDSGMAELLPEVAADRGGTVSGARSVHPVHEAEEHAPPHYGAGFDYPPRVGLLRLMTRRAVSA